MQINGLTLFCLIQIANRHFLWGMLPVEMAAQQNISLLDAYLRHRLQEEKKIAAAAEKRQQAAAQSAGSLSRGAVQTPPEQDAFLRAFRSAL